MNASAPDCTPTVLQHPSAVLPVVFDFATRHLAQYWQPGASVDLSFRVRPRNANGFEYECTSAGQTRAADREPTWPLVPGQTVVDGSVTWTCRLLSTASLSGTVQSVTWTADSGITLSGQSLQGQAARAFVGGGTDGQTYRITATATCSDGTTPVGEVFVLVTKAAPRGQW